MSMGLITVTLVITFLLAGVANGAPDGLVRNFKVASQNATHVTFSWDMHSSYAYIGNINYFQIYYRYAFPGYNPYSFSNYYQFSVSQTTQINGGLTFLFTTSVTRFSNYAQYVMWLYVYHDTAPNNLYSEQIYAEVGATSAIELKIKLWNGQTCFDFTSAVTTSNVGNEVYRALRIYCQCTYEFINVIRIVTGYFDCSPTGYVTYRAYMTSTDATKRPSTLVGALNNWLQDTNNSTIIAGGRKYTVVPGACGVTVPYTNAPFCSANTPTQRTASIASAVESSQTTQKTDNTAVIVASVFAAMFFILALGLVAYILATKRATRKLSQPVSAEPVATGNSTNQYINPQPAKPPAANRQPYNASIEQGPYEPLHR